MREVGKEELREIQVNILKSVHEFCVEQGLRYSLSCGTLLGAVRHKGFIPWDDDIEKAIRLVYEQYKLIQFEGLSFYCVADTHQFLESLYGDYMQLPPVERRVGRHNIHAYWL